MTGADFNAHSSTISKTQSYNQTNDESALLCPILFSLDIPTPSAAPRQCRLPASAEQAPRRSALNAQRLDRTLSLDEVTTRCLSCSGSELQEEVPDRILQLCWAAKTANGLRMSRTVMAIATGCVPFQSIILSSPVVLSLSECFCRRTIMCCGGIPADAPSTRTQKVRL
jgi:hypothetical protein